MERIVIDIHLNRGAVEDVDIPRDGVTVLVFDEGVFISRWDIKGEMK